MLKLNLENIKPVSINDAYYMRNKQYNQKARLYRDKFHEQLALESNQNYLQGIRDSFDKYKHYLSVTFHLQYPKDILLTKKGYLSRRKGDSDNLLKLPTDFLTNDKYDSALGIDDQFISRTTASQSLSPNNSYYILIDIVIKELSELC